jgi:hypothetical protein
MRPLIRRKDEKRSPRVIRETAFIDYRTRRPVVICLEEGGRFVRLWVKRNRRNRAYTVPYSEIWTAGARIRAAELKAEKARRRKDRREQRA